MKSCVTLFRRVLSNTLYSTNSTEDSKCLLLYTDQLMKCTIYELLLVTKYIEVYGGPFTPTVLWITAPVNNTNSIQISKCTALHTDKR